MTVQLSFELVVETFHLFQRISLHFAQHVTIKFDCFGRTKFETQSFAAFYITFIEDVPSETLDFIGDIPAFVIGNAFVDVIQ